VLLFDHSNPEFPMPDMDGRYLSKRFSEFNRIYFGGSLPKYAIASSTG
jgi:hypothetical protein